MKQPWPHELTTYRGCQDIWATPVRQGPLAESGLIPAAGGAGPSALGATTLWEHLQSMWRPTMHGVELRVTMSGTGQSAPAAAAAVASVLVVRGLRVRMGLHCGVEEGNAR